jgi:Domain of unknown function (DUF4157)
MAALGLMEPQSDEDDPDREEEETLEASDVEAAADPVQRKASPSSESGGSGTTERMAATAARGVSGPAEALPHAGAIQAAFGATHDVSSIGAHVGGAAAKASDQLGADAYATSNHVAFHHEPSLHTAAHEAAHVMQQRAGVQLLGGVSQAGDVYERNADEVADRVVAGQSAQDLLPKGGNISSTGGGVQLRRVPTNSRTLLTDPGDPAKAGANNAAHSTGVRRLIQRAQAEMSAAEKKKVRVEMRGSLSMKAFSRLPVHERLARQAEAIGKVRPDLLLGDPKLIDTGPRAATADTANLQKLVDNARKVFTAVIGGAHNKDLEDVFGAANVATAKVKYSMGQLWMVTLHSTGHIVTDRSGYSEEVFLGGLTGFQQQIALSPGTIDQPDDMESIITMIHEAMHAGNGDVDDKGYIDQPSFTELPDADKLTNAAHFEVVPRRTLGASHSFPGITFIPAGATVGGVTAPSLTPAQEAIRAASETLREAWTIALNLHSLYTDLFKDQTLWAVNRGGGETFKTSLPYWSKVEMMTIHQKTAIDPTSADAAKLPISQIDMALSEGVTRKLGLAMFEVPEDEAKAKKFEKDHSTASQRTAAHATVDKHRDFLIKLVLAQPSVAPITGAVSRDQRVVKELAGLDWGTVTNARNPNDFSD